MSCPFPEHHGGSGGSGLDVILVVGGILAALIVVTWVVHLLLMIATVIGGAVMIGGAGYGYLRYCRWRAELGSGQARYLPPGQYPGARGDQAPGIHLHIHGEVPEGLLSQLTQAHEQAQQPGTVPARRALHPGGRPSRRRPPW